MKRKSQSLRQSAFKYTNSIVSKDNEKNINEQSRRSRQSINSINEDIKSENEEEIVSNYYKKNRNEQSRRSRLSINSINENNNQEEILSNSYKKNEGERTKRSRQSLYSINADIKKNNQEEILSNAYKKNGGGRNRRSRHSLYSINEDIKSNNQEEILSNSYKKNRNEQTRRSRQSINSINDYIRKKKQEEILSNAYKNLMTVISNILDTIEDQKINGKSNLKNIKQQVNKKPVKKLVSYTPAKTKFNLKNANSPDNLSFKSPAPTKKSLEILDSDSNHRNNLLNIYNDLHSNFTSNKSNSFKTLNKNSIKKFEVTELNSSTNMGKKLKRERGYQSGIKNSSKKTIKNIFFKPKNKLKMNSKKVRFNMNNLIKSNYSSTISGSGIVQQSSSKKSNFKFRESSQGGSKFKSTITANLKNREENNKTNIFTPFNAIKKNINIDTKTIKQKLYEYENNEITHQINLLPDDDLLLRKKRNLRKKKNAFTLENKVKNIISLKPLQSNYVKNMGQYYKENNFRKLMEKGHVYDSLDDEEESDEEDIDNCYIDPNNKILRIIDGIIFASSLIILLYFPIYLAKKKFFCKNPMSIDIIFYLIDYMFIIDFIIYFYRAYYNYNEELIKKNILIFIHYIKTWFLLDLICAIPFYSIFISNQSKCLYNGIYNDSKLNNHGIHSNHYNIKLNNMHFLFTFLKALKIFKVFKNNIALKKIKGKLKYIDFIYDWGNVFFYTFFFFSFLNFGACLFIFVGRNTSNNWILSEKLEKLYFFDIYLGAIQYLIETVTTVGYGEIQGSTINEIIFQVIMLIVGTCIYSWLISSISTYVKKNNEKDLKYEEKIQVLEEIKLNYPNFKEKLYDKILRLLHYRKFHEEEAEKNVVLESLPNSLKNTLIIEMYRNYIDGFLFFRNIENREFIVQVISKLKTCLGIKGDVLVQEGEFFEDIIFIKNGILSLEIWIDMTCTEESIKNYLIDNGFINNSKKKKLKTIKIKSRKSFQYEEFYNDDNINTNNDNNANNLIIDLNKKKIKVLDIRKNEHFGDVFMFLNKKSPFYIRVVSHKADLLLLKKLDALNISYKYPDIWKAILKKPLANVKIINHLTLKILSSFCNFNGIKTKLFKKKKNNKYYPPNYFRPVLNPIKRISLKKEKKQKEDFNLDEKKEGIQMKLKNFIHTVSIKNANKFLNKNIFKDDNDFDNNSLNSDNNIIYEEEDEADASSKKRRRSVSNINSQRKNSFNIENSSVMLIDQNSEKEIVNISDINNQFKKMYSYNNEDEKEIPQKKNSDKKVLSQKKQNQYKIIINKPDEKKINEKNSNNNISTTSNNKLDFNLAINDEIYPGENFDLESFVNEKNNKLDNKNILLNTLNINNNREKLSEPVFINNLNIIGANYIGSSSEDKKNLEERIKYLESELQKKKSFNTLEVSSSVSTLEISSSYENINEIADNKYISNQDLRDMTKQFIQKRNININIMSNKGDSIVESELDNNKNFLKLPNVQEQQHSLSKISSNRKINKTKLSVQNNSNIEIMLKSIIENPLNQTNPAENFIKKIKSINGSSTNVKRIGRASVDIKSNHSRDFFTEKKKSNTLEEKVEQKSSKNSKVDSHKKINHNSSVKKKKKKNNNNDLDLIALNIQKSSQNLNQPDLFYAGLFSQLIFKGNNNNLDSKDNNNHKDGKKKEGGYNSEESNS